MNEPIEYTVSQKVAEIFDLYTELHNIRISLFSPDGRLIYPDPTGRPDCAHCRMLRKQLEFDDTCRALDRKMMDQALERGEMLTYTCHAGMVEAVAPIFVEETLFGFVMLGQFRSEAAPAQSPYLEKGGDALQDQYEQTPIYPQNKVETLLSMFQLLMEFIVSNQLIHRKDYDLVQPVMQRIHDRPEQALHLDDAARLVGRSASTVTRQFKKLTGQSFKQYQTTHRMNLAARQLSTMPNRPVTDIAQAVGYDDPLYFSRIFKKTCGLSPSEYRQKNEYE